MRRIRFKSGCAAVVALVLLLAGTAGGASAATVLPGGMPFGLRLSHGGVTVAGVTDVISESGETVRPAEACGIAAGDLILALDGTECTSVADVTDAVANCGGRAITVSLRRGERCFSAALRPVRSKPDGDWRAGLFLRDNTAGIGTVTYIDPETGDFAGLGHGVCTDAEGGALLPMRKASVYGVTVTGVERSVGADGKKHGSAGQLRGIFDGSAIGICTRNEVSGVYGRLSGEALGAWCRGAVLPPLETATSPDSVREGDATILTTLDRDGVKSYAIRIERVNRTAGGDGRNFLIRVTDPALLEKTGGIVRGMSGSPIIQDGKLVGAVTHVLVDTPSTGYGIFIGNMIQKSTQRVLF